MTNLHQVINPKKLDIDMFFYYSFLFKEESLATEDQMSNINPDGFRQKIDSVCGLHKAHSFNSLCGSATRKISIYTASQRYACNIMLAVIYRQRKNSYQSSRVGRKEASNIP